MLDSEMDLKCIDVYMPAWVSQINSRQAGSIGPHKFSMSLLRNNHPLLAYNTAQFSKLDGTEGPLEPKAPVGGQFARFAVIEKCENGRE